MTSRLLQWNGRPRTKDGWTLELFRYSAPDRRDRSLKPLLIVPGYGMNSFILAYHPRGVSLVEHLALDGFEVWTTNLRGQGGASRSHGEGSNGLGPIGLSPLARIDLPRVIEEIFALTESDRNEVDVIGCSLGGAIVYGYLAHEREAPVGAIVSMGAPLRWERIHPLLRVAFASRRVAGALKIRGTRSFARVALPALRRVPGALSLYMNAKNIDLSNPEILTQTVDDPSPELNRELAEWFRTKDLHLDGLNVTEAIAGRPIPALAIIANADGIVPKETVRSIERVLPSVDLLEVGDDRDWFAHADLFINDRARELVFDPLGSWLRGKNGEPLGQT
ncbi:MAG: alpha/beta fold hydrolase [Deltaproteobacteria bacterium]|nr:alpha/beta fold hydrolase [Deltaproteobacteria bacterium]